MQIIHNASLKSHNSFAVEVTCQYLAKLDQVDELTEILAQKQFRDLPLLILGSGSNLLFRKNFQGLVAVVSNRGIELIEEDNDHYYVKAAAGENWHQFVQYCIRQGWSGLENLSLIPGTVGAAPMQNIGAYGVELADRLHKVSAIDLESREHLGFSRDDCQFAYRDSLFKRQRGRYCIKDITVKLPKDPQWVLDYAGIRESMDEAKEINARHISEAVCRLRRSKLPDPEVLGNAGSFFKNPVVDAAQHEQLHSHAENIPSWETDAGQYKLSAAWLIEQCGWKGKRQGDAGIYDKHALVLVNHGTASGEQLWQLAETVIKAVEDRFAITLEPEPLIL